MQSQLYGNGSVIKKQEKYLLSLAYYKYTTYLCRCKTTTCAKILSNVTRNDWDAWWLSVISFLLIMNDLQVFKNEDFGQLQVKTSEENELYFNATHVCEALGMTNVTVSIESLDEDERSKFNLGRQGETWFVNESGLYHLIFKSRKPFAKKFRKWVTSEVLPSIRRTGTYTLPAATEMFPLYQDILLSRYSGKRRERILVLIEKLTPLVPSFPKGEWHIFNDDIDAIWHSKGYENMQPGTLVHLCIEAMRILGYKVENRGIHWRILS